MQYLVKLSKKNYTDQPLTSEIDLSQNKSEQSIHILLYV